MSDVVSKSYFQQRQRNRLYETVINAVEEAAKEGIRKRDIASKIGKSPSKISHFLSGPANWTIDSVSDVLYAIEAELDFSVVNFKDKTKSNRYHPVNELKAAEYPVPVTQTTGTVSGSPDSSGMLASAVHSSPQVTVTIKQSA